MRPLLEVCCADAESVRAACGGEADRIELCSSLETGGLTPSEGLINFAVRLIPGRVHVLIRPRGGDFLYTPDERDVILADIRRAVALGASGVVCGALRRDGNLDTEFMREMLEAAGGASFTLHRAFDLCRDPEKALEEAVGLGIDRILTSGLAPTAVEGIPTLRRLRQQAAGRILIMAGSGVNYKNAPRILRKTGVDELHASCKRKEPSQMVYRREDVSMSAPGSDEYSHPITSIGDVILLTQSIRNL